MAFSFKFLFYRSIRIWLLLCRSQCDLYSFGVLLQRLSLHLLFFWWTHPRGVVATFQHLLQLRVFPLQVLVFLHQIDCNPSSQHSSVPQLMTNPHPNPLPWGRLNTNISQSLTPSVMRFLSNPLLFPTNPHLVPGWGFTLTPALLTHDQLKFANIYELKTKDTWKKPLMKFLECSLSLEKPKLKFFPTPLSRKSTRNSQENLKRLVCKINSAIARLIEIYVLQISSKKLFLGIFSL